MRRGADLAGTVLFVHVVPATPAPQAHMHPAQGLRTPSSTIGSTAKVCAHVARLGTYFKRLELYAGWATKSNQHGQTYANFVPCGHVTVLPPPCTAATQPNPCHIATSQANLLHPHPVPVPCHPTPCAHAYQSGFVLPHPPLTYVYIPTPTPTSTPTHTHPPSTPGPHTPTSCCAITLPPPPLAHHYHHRQVRGGGRGTLPLPGACSRPPLGLPEWAQGCDLDVGACRQNIPGQPAAAPPDGPRGRHGEQRACAAARWVFLGAHLFAPCYRQRARTPHRRCADGRVVQSGASRLMGEWLEMASR